MSKKKKNVGSSTVKENKIETIMENDAVVVETVNAKKDDEIDTVDIIDEKRAEVTSLDDSESIIEISEDSKETGDLDKDDENETLEKAKSQDDEDEGFLDDEDEDEGFLDDEDEDEGFLDDDEDETDTKEAEKNQQESENTDGSTVINAEIMEEESDESEKKKHKFLKPLLITLGSITGLVLLVYLIGVIFFI
ncbi:MAG: hypothetical protein PHX08_25865, partial [Lachnospiraceae bacterium]|nr:hypothetical protein [Lachnospiraceae bacterium]